MGRGRGARVLVFMRKAALLYNPAAGRRREQRTAEVERAAAALRALGIETMMVPTRGPGTAGEQAAEAEAAGCDTVFACGGDGTIHEVLQGLVGRQAALAAIPLGTGNALIHDLGVTARDPARVAEIFARATPQRVAAGKVEYLDKRSGHMASRYFTIFCGIGADAMVFYSLDAEFKLRHGMLAYWAEGMRLLLTHSYPPFTAEVVTTTGERRTLTVHGAAAVRIRYFHPLVGTPAPRAHFARNDFEFALVTTRNLAKMALIIAHSITRGLCPAAGVEFVAGTQMTCSPVEVESGRIYAEADGEFLGGLPVRISIVPEAFTLLVP